MKQFSKVFVFCAVALAAASASAQDSGFELGGTLGWTFSDGVSGDPVTVPGVGSFDAVDPKSAFSWGLRGAYLVNPQLEVGFLFSQQSTSLEVTGSLAAGGSTRVDVGDESIRNYHGFVAWSFGDERDALRPYVLGGLGATEYGAVNAQIGDTQRTIGGSTRFSSTWAAGVKVNTSERLGLRFEARWTPTYVKSDASGWWCDPFWGCYVVSDAQYSNQFEMSGGLTLRF